MTIYFIYELLYLSVLNTTCLFYDNIRCLWLATYLYWIPYVLSMKIYFVYDFLPISTDYTTSDLWQYTLSMTFYLLWKQHVWSMRIYFVYDLLPIFTDYNMSNLLHYTLSMSCYLSVLNVNTICLIYDNILCLRWATYPPPDYEYKGIPK